MWHGPRRTILAAALALIGAAPAEAADLVEPAPAPQAAAVVEIAQDAAAVAQPAAAVVATAVQAAADATASSEAARTVERAPKSLQSAADKGVALVSDRVPSVAVLPVRPALKADEPVRTTTKPAVPAPRTRSADRRREPASVGAHPRRSLHFQVPAPRPRGSAVKVDDAPATSSEPRSERRAGVQSSNSLPLGSSGSAEAPGSGWSPPLVALLTALLAVRRRERGRLIPLPPSLPRAAKLVSLLERPG